MHCFDAAGGKLNEQGCEQWWAQNPADQVIGQEQQQTLPPQAPDGHLLQMADAMGAEKNASPNWKSGQLGHTWLQIPFPVHEGGMDYDIVQKWRLKVGQFGLRHRVLRAGLERGTSLLRSAGLERGSFVVAITIRASTSTGD